MDFKHSLVPKDGIKPVVVIGARISGSPSPKDVSLDDQIDHGKELTCGRRWKALRKRLGLPDAWAITVLAEGVV